jgi:hypothetical protein
MAGVVATEGVRGDLLAQFVTAGVDERPASLDQSDTFGGPAQTDDVRSCVDDAFVDVLLPGAGGEPLLLW